MTHGVVSEKIIEMEINADAYADRLDMDYVSTHRHAQHYINLISSALGVIYRPL